MLEHNGINFSFESQGENNHIMRRSGFGWDNVEKLWKTPFADKAIRVIDKKDKQKVLELINKKRIEKELYQRSFGTVSELIPPSNGTLSFLPYQRAGIQEILDRPDILLADDAGLGKTIQVAGAINILKPSKLLIICPASIKINWNKELNIWCTVKRKISLIQSCMVWDDEADTYIINYERLKGYESKLREIKWDMLVIDEAHFCKNPKAQRSLGIFGGRSKKENRSYKPLVAKRKIALTGTPVVNKPIEFYPILKYLLPYGFPNKFEFAKRYCAAQHTRFGWDVSGSSNSDELQKLLRSTIMVRREKKYVLKYLPPKRRQIIEIEPSGEARKLLSYEDDIWARILSALGIKDTTKLTDEEQNKIMSYMDSGCAVGFEEMSKVRRDIALTKLPMVIDHVSNCIESGKVVVFCHHREVAEKLKEHFPTGVMVIGGMNEKDKDKAVEKFQNDPSANPFIGNIRAAGVGLTLTASSHVVFAEGSWVPGDLSQAEDRCHRIGSKGEYILIQHIVLQGSLDAYMCKQVVRKQEVIDKIINNVEGSELAELLE